MAIVPGAGATLGYTVTTPPVTYTLISQIVEIDTPDIDNDEADNTLLISGAKQTRPTLTNYNQLKFKIFLDPADAGHIALYAAAIAKTAQVNFQLTMNDVGHSPRLFSGWIKKFGGSPFKVKDNVESEIVIELNSLDATLS